MMKRYVSMVLIGLLGITASADAAPQNALPWYVGLQLGQSDADVPGTVDYSGTVSNTPFTLPAKLTTSAGFSYRLFVGKDIYRAGANTVAIEGGYLQLGQVKYSGNFADITPSVGLTGNIDVVGSLNGFDVLGVWNYQFSPKFYALGKLGVANIYNSMKSTSSDLTVVQNESVNTTKILPELVLGGGFQFSSQFSGQLTVTKLFGGSIPSSVTDLSQIGDVPSFMIYSLGLAYKF